MFVMTADCLPVLFTNKQGTGSGSSSMQAGADSWDGILEETVKCFQSAPEEIIAWFGPAIGPNAFQVGKEVIEQFMAFDPIAETAFRPDPNESGKYLGNLYQIATQRLNKLGITQIYGGEHCTFNEKESSFPIVEMAKQEEWRV